MTRFAPAAVALAFALSCCAVSAEDPKPALSGSDEPCSNSLKEGSPPKRIGGNIHAPKLLKKKAPEFPRTTAIREPNRFGAKVFLQAIIEKDGSVSCLEVLSTGVRRKGEKEADPELQKYAPWFETEAKQEVRQWQYAPATEDGKPVRVLFPMIVDFVVDE